MLTERDIDNIANKIQLNVPVYVYYVAHNIEGKETDTIDEHTYKDVSRFRVIKIRVNNIQNAYHELLNFINKPNEYTEKIYEYWYDQFTKYNHYFISKKTDTNQVSNPSIIYGYRRKIEDKIYTEESPVKPIFTNDLIFLDKSKSETLQLFNNGKLDYKYIKLKNKEIVDGIEYGYVTSKFFIIDLDYYPMSEKPLIAMNEHSSYFMNVEDAFRYIEQLIA